MGSVLPVITEPRERQDNTRELLCPCPECLSSTGESRAPCMETKPLPKLRKTQPESGEGARCRWATTSMGTGGWAWAGQDRQGWHLPLAGFKSCFDEVVPDQVSE